MTLASGRKRVVVFISGGGSNMVSLADACAADDFPAEIVAVISDKPDAGGLATAAPIPALCDSAGLDVDVEAGLGVPDGKGRAHRCRIADIAHHELGRRVQVGALAGGKVVQHPNPVPRRQQRIH